MKQVRLKAIANFIDKEDRVADIGCDHAYLDIYLKENELCTSIIASDIHPKALERARENILKKQLDIPLFLSDGVEKLDQSQLNTLVISGMGTKTILHIMKQVDKNFIKKIIIQSNNDLNILRKKMTKYGYFLEEEQVILENGHYYVIGKYTTRRRKHPNLVLEFGLYKKENLNYYLFLQNKLKSIKSNLGKKHFLKKIKIQYKLFLLQNYL